MFQMRPGVVGRLGFVLVTALIRPELPRLLSVGLLQGQGVWAQPPDHPWPQGSHQSRERRAGGSLGTLPGKFKSACNAGGRIWNKSLSICRTKNFCSTKLRLCRCWLHSFYIVHENFCFKLNNISGVIRLLASSVFFFFFVSLCIT